MLVKIPPTNLGVMDWRRLTFKTSRLILLKGCLHLSSQFGKVRGIVYGLPVLQALAINLLDCCRHSLTVIHLPSVPAELEFV